MRTLLTQSALYAGLLPLLLTACASPAAGADALRRIDADGIFQLSVGERVALEGGTLRYLRVANDSRCPPGVQCIWAGDAEVVLQWTATGAQPDDFSLHTGRGERSRNVGKQRLTLESLAHGANPVASLRLDAIP